MTAVLDLHDCIHNLPETGCTGYAEIYVYSCLLIIFRLSQYATPSVQHGTNSAILFVGPSEVSAPGFASRTGFAGALVYYLSVYVLEALKPAEGLALVTFVFVLHGLCSDLLRQPLDWTYPLAIVAHKIANVPMPSAQIAAKKPQNKQAALPSRSSTHSSTDKKKHK